MTEDRSKLQEYVDSLEYMPEELRDSHKLKNIFKAIEDNIVVNRRESKDINHREGNINWCDAYIYTGDIFLYFMALHGYTLQRSTEDIPFYDLDRALILWKEKDRENRESKRSERENSKSSERNTSEELESMEFFGGNVKDGSSVKSYIESIKSDEHTKVYFRFSGYGDSAVMEIDKFLVEFVSYTIGPNGEFIKPDGTILHSCYIRRTG